MTRQESFKAKEKPESEADNFSNPAIIFTMHTHGGRSVCEFLFHSIIHVQIN